MLSNKKIKKQGTDNKVVLSENDLLDLYNANYSNNELVDENIEEYVIYDDNSDEDLEEYQVVLDEDSDEKIIEKEEIIEEKEEHIEKEIKKPINYHTINKIINILFGIILVILLLITVDIILVGKYEIGPFFAIPVKKYNDGGSKAYYGLGYKVIKYKQKVGRRDIEVGTYHLKYNTTPVDTTSLDLAIEFTNNENKAYKKYYKKFVRISGTLTKAIDDKLLIRYSDEDGKYAIDIICITTSKNNDLLENNDITIIGTVYDYDLKTLKNPTRLYIKNCFAEQ